MDTPVGGGANLTNNFLFGGEGINLIATKLEEGRT